MTPEQPSRKEPFPREPIPADLLAWARQTFDEEEFMARVREIRATGGVHFEDFISEIEARPGLVTERVAHYQVVYSERARQHLLSRQHVSESRHAPPIRCSALVRRCRPGPDHGSTSMVMSGKFASWLSLVRNTSQPDSTAAARWRASARPYRFGCAGGIAG